METKNNTASIDLAQLEALARAADPNGAYHLVTHYRHGADVKAEEAWRQAATPAAVRQLIDLVRRAQPRVTEQADERAKLSQDEVIELLRAAGIPDNQLRLLYGGHGLTLYLEHLTTFANTTRAALTQQAAPEAPTENAELTTLLEKLHEHWGDCLWIDASELMALEKVITSAPAAQQAGAAVDDGYRWRDCEDCGGSGRISPNELCARCEKSGILPAATTASASYEMPEGVKNQIETLGWKLRNHERALEMRKLHDKGDVWYWQGDGGDNLESMSMGMVVVICADDFRAALARAQAPSRDAAPLEAIRTLRIALINAAVKPQWAESIAQRALEATKQFAGADLAQQGASHAPLTGDAAELDACAAMRAQCGHCGGTGDVHRGDGEYIGECWCKASGNDGLTAAERTFVEVVRQRPGHKLNSGEAWGPEGQALWEAPENLGLIRCVGSFKWVVPGAQAQNPVADAVRAAIWSADAPTEQRWYWHWSGNPDDAPFPLSVLWSGTAKKCFVSMNQTESGTAEWCDEYGGYWTPIVEPRIPETLPKKGKAR
jgi:hypothetical protein